jgi:multidrug efflux pump subunit AcrA (membrane-fusion protein)
LLETRSQALVIPPAGVQRGPQGTFVYVVVDGKAETRPVQVALTTADMAVIDKGLNAGDQVVVEGQNQLRPGVPVNVRSAGGGGGKGDGGGHGKSEGGAHGGQSGKPAKSEHAP